MSAFTDREIVESFIASIDDLGESKYLTQARQGGIGSALIMSPAINGAMLARSNPDRDHLKAVILTIRFFCQDNEPTSLRRMDELLNRLNLTDEEKDTFRAARRELNEHFAKPPVMQFTPTVGAESCGNTFQTFLYGEYAHATPDKKRLFATWKSLDYFDNIKSQFDVTLLTFISVLAKMRLVLKQAIDAQRI